MRRALIVICSLMLLCLTFGTACTQKPQTAKIKIVSDIEKLEDHAEYPGEFWPEHITVGKGTVVTWTNDDAKEHAVTSDTGLFNHKLAPGASFSFTFKDTGAFKYRCELFHEMMGEIVVE